MDENIDRRTFLGRALGSWATVPRVIRYPVNAIAVPAIGAYTLGSITAGLVDLYAAIAVAREDLPHKEEGLAVLISYQTLRWWETFFKPVSKLYIPGYVGSIELAFGQKADRVVRGATQEDLLEVLVDDAIQNIVVYGHGTWRSWLATDQTVSVGDIYHCYHTERRDARDKKEVRPLTKRGLFVRHTCGLEKMKYKSYFKGDENEWREFMRSVSSLGFAITQVINNKEIKIGGGITATNSYYRQGERDHIDIEYTLYMKRPIHGHKQLPVGVHMTSPDDVDVMYTSLVDALKSTGKSFPEGWETALADSFIPVREYLTAHYVQGPWENEVFGRPFYPRENIRGWEGISTPFHFLFNPLGNK